MNVGTKHRTVMFSYIIGRPTVITAMFPYRPRIREKKSGFGNEKFCLCYTIISEQVDGSAWYMPNPDYRNDKHLAKSVESGSETEELCVIALNQVGETDLIIVYQLPNDAAEYRKAVCRLLNP